MGLCLGPFRVPGGGGLCLMSEVPLYNAKLGHSPATLQTSLLSLYRLICAFPVSSTLQCSSGPTVACQRHPEAGSSCPAGAPRPEAYASDLLGPLASAYSRVLGKCVCF